MQNLSSQLRITLPVRLDEQLQRQADKYGLTKSGYVKNLIIDDIKSNVYPVTQASQKTEQAYMQAKRTEKRGTLKPVPDIAKFLTDL